MRDTNYGMKAVPHEGLHPHLYASGEHTWSASITVGDTLFHVDADRPMAALSALCTRLGAALANRREASRCGEEGCDRPGIYAAPDGGPDAFCGQHLWDACAEPEVPERVFGELEPAEAVWGNG